MWRTLKRPWLHFLMLGSMLFFVQRELVVAPKPVIGPLSEARIESLRQQWLAATGTLPSESQQSSMLAHELDREMLFQRALELELHRHDPVVYQRLLRNMSFLGIGEGDSDEVRYRQALKLRLHLGDEVIKRRLIQIMEQVLLARNPPQPVSEAALRSAFESRREELRHPPRYTISHLYFSRDREAALPAAIARIEQEKLSAEQARGLSSPFLPGYQFRAQTPDQLARHFGAAFVLALEESSVKEGEWVGPLRSAYGLHYVWVDSIEPARDARFEEVRQRLQRDEESTARLAALNAALQDLRQNYELRL